jgi:hypothetical protein
MKTNLFNQVLQNALVCGVWMTLKAHVGQKEVMYHIQLNNHYESSLPFKKKGHFKKIN